MSIWSKEVLKVGGEFKVFVEIQNDYTGVVTAGIRNIFEEDGKKYFRADGIKHYITDECNKAIQYEEKVKQALKFYNNYNKYV